MPRHRRFKILLLRTSPYVLYAEKGHFSSAMEVGRQLSRSKTWRVWWSYHSIIIPGEANKKATHTSWDVSPDSLHFACCNFWIHSTISNLILFIPNVQNYSVQLVHQTKPPPMKFCLKFHNHYETLFRISDGFDRNLHFSLVQFRLKRLELTCFSWTGHVTDDFFLANIAPYWDIWTMMFCSLVKGKGF